MSRLAPIYPEVPLDPEEKSTLIQSRLGFPVVGLGGSAGGMRAVTQFLASCPNDTGMAIVVILHLSPRHVSQAAEILQRHTNMKVLQVTRPVVVEPDHVYVIPPSKMLTMNDSYLRLSPLARAHGQRHASVDLFFRSLGTVHRERAIAVVLSGTGADGSVGIARVKEQGGVTIAQLPEEAEHAGMPQAAIATGLVDMVLPVAQIADKIMEIWRNAKDMEMPQASEDPMEYPDPPPTERSASTEQALEDILELLFRETRNDFRHYKRATVLRRIERRMQVTRTADLAAYRDYLAAHSAEAQPLLQDMLISVTNFFRDREAFETIERDVIGPLFRNATAEDSVRVWVPGCATGEEAYSLTMLLCEQADRHPRPPNIQVFGTDIDERAIAIARTGLYPESIVTDVPPGRLSRFFVREEEHYKVRKGVRDKILFATHNILRDAPFSKLDIVSCRNLLIYLERDVQREILETLHFALKPGGHLILGTSESADAAPHRFTLVDRKNRIYRAVKSTAKPRSAPAMRLGSAPVTERGIKPVAANTSRPSFADIHVHAQQQSAPPSVLVDESGMLVHTARGAGRFLRLSAGEPSHELLKLVAEPLRPSVRSVLFQAGRSGQRAQAPVVVMEIDGVPRAVSVWAQPYRDESTGLSYGLVTFEESDPVSRDNGAQAGPAGRDEVLARLEEELQHTRQQLQETLERSETFHEETRASNEELQSANEELRSASEELETSKEELQSLNEELVTVNHEMKTKVEEISKINDDLQNLIGSTEIPTIFVDRVLCIKRFTPRATDWFNLLPQDVGRPLLDITHRLNYQSLADDVAAAMATCQVIERDISTTNGRCLFVRALPYRTTENMVEGAVMTFIDVTEHRAAQASVQRSEKLLRAVIDSARSYAIITLDDAGIITSWNAGAVNVYGWRDDEAIGMHHEALFAGNERDAGRPAWELAEARRQGRVEAEYACVRKDGVGFWAAVATTRLETDDTAGYAKICQDATQARQAEAAREAMLRHEQSVRHAAEAARDMKDEFLAVMSHELKHPLNLIHVNAELLRRLPEARAVPAVARAADTICQTVAGQAKIIDDLLDLSRMQTGKFSLHPRRVPLARLLTPIAQAAQAEALQRGLTLEARIETGDLEIYCDPVRIEQIAWNLLSNALKFTTEGSVSFSVLCEGRYCLLRVQDTGQGISPDFLPRVFDMFRQADSRTTRRTGGLGIGLALVRQVAEAHGGWVQAASEGEGRGATFTVWLPLHAGAESETPEVIAEPAGLQGRRVLLVEDTAETREAFAELLGAEGADVVQADSGASALALARAEAFDLILSDIGMPGMDGLEMMRQMRELPLHQGTPAVALTGYGRPSDAERAFAAGFNAHVSKPVSLEALFEAIAKAQASRGE